jgi:NAD(P)-dependent dehydrogenase (short-subunit alcohol dehydrogenase family)
VSTISFAGRVAIVTGAGGGLGRDYALDLARRGAAVVVNDLGTNSDGTGGPSRMADRVVDEIRAAGIEAVASYDSVATAVGGEAIVATAMKAFGRVDVLINNAGILRNAPFDELQDSTIDAMLSVHLKGAFNVTRPAYRLMKRQGYGRILFASSAAGLFGNAEQAAYGAAKAGLVGLMNVLSLEGRAHGVLCNALLPTAESRMGAQMSAAQMKDFGEIYALAGPCLGNSGTPPFVTPLVVYLVSEACDSTHGIYSASLGRYARVFVAASNGWIGPRDKAPSAEDIEAHFATICDQKNVTVPESLRDEFVDIIKLLQKS